MHAYYNYDKFLSICSSVSFLVMLAVLYISCSIVIFVELYLRLIDE